MSRVLIISADGLGAGKTTLAARLGGAKFSFADSIRHEMREVMPDVNWFDKSQAGKLAVVRGTGGKTVRDLLIQVGQERRAENPNYWVEKTAYLIQKFLADWDSRHVPPVVVDDLRFLNELAYFRDIFGDDLTHIHVSSPGATPEPQYQNVELAAVADYTVTWGDMK